MPTDTIPPIGQPLRPGLVVAPAAAIAGVLTPDGSMVPREALGPGVVEKFTPDGRVRVRWMDAEFDAWMDPADLRPRGAYAHVISVYQCDGRGHNILQRRHVVDKEGFSYNWMIELRPNDVVRAVRSDGAAWTFRWHPDISFIDTAWPQPPEDPDAEALTAVEQVVM
jgi:hypothetical protein